MSIIVRIKNVYGQDLVYPVCEKARHFATLTGKKTLTGYALRTIENLGFEIYTVSTTEVETPTL